MTKTTKLQMTLHPFCDSLAKSGDVPRAAASSLTAENPEKEDMAYVAFCKCGGMVMAAVDKWAFAEDTAREVADCIKRGYRIERVTVEAVRTTIEFCKNHGNC